MKVKKLSSLSIFFPCYNDEKTIGKLVEQAYEVGRKVANKLEVVVVDDASVDNSRKVLKKLQRQHPSLRLIFHPENRGYGAALRAGFQAATKDFIFYTDGDAQYDIKELIKLITKMTEKVDVVNGKIKRHSSVRDIAGGLYRSWIKFLFGLPISDVNVAFRLVRKSILDKITLEIDSAAFCVELVSKLHLAGARFVEVPVTHYSRQFGQSQFFTVGRIVKTILDDMLLFWQLRLKG